MADCRADVCGFIAGSVADCHSDRIVLTPVMLYHKQLRHYVCYHRAWRLLLASC
ncbi:hypothetical protein ACLK14_24500 [Escherichia coli]